MMLDESEAGGQGSSLSPDGGSIPMPFGRPASAPSSDVASSDAGTASVDALPNYGLFFPSLTLSSLPEVEPFDDRERWNYSISMDNLPSMRDKRPFDSRSLDKLSSMRNEGSYDLHSHHRYHVRRSLDSKAQSRISKMSDVSAHSTFDALNWMDMRSGTVDSLPQIHQSSAPTPLETWDELPALGPQVVLPERAHSSYRGAYHGDPFAEDVTTVRVVPPTFQLGTLRHILRRRNQEWRNSEPRNHVVEYGLYVFGLLDSYDGPL
eukprot:TRINITY_DN4065_c0_g2_i1.p1 TRINITY_DN4065_c0_g2~~TRINITY_DN4065_c0_g2_i1.p1  ORF type:complete len:264 (-),score=22.11 TRINITY_DN4065_c0_g2_i1:306-1097(-)